MVEAATSVPPDDSSDSIRWLLVLSWLTVGWLAIDGAIGMAAGAAANSIALIGWGLDCAIQTAATLVIIWRFTGARIDSGDAERRARKAIAVSYFVLVPYIVVAAASQISSGGRASASWVGVTLAAIDAALMPVLGGAKRYHGARLRSPATASAGSQNILCAYLSMAVLRGLLANALFGIWWADSLVALLVAAACTRNGYVTLHRDGTDEDGCV